MSYIQTQLIRYFLPLAGICLTNLSSILVVRQNNGGRTGLGYSAWHPSIAVESGPWFFSPF